MDLYSKQAHFALTNATVDTNGIADLMLQHVFRLHGLPRGVISDRGPQFASKLIKALYQKLGITSQLTTAYHPQANGQTERMNKEIEQYLRTFTRQRQDDWATLLPVGEFVINNRFQSALQRSPFEVLYGYQPDFTIPVGGQSNMPAADTRIEQLKESLKDADAALRRSKAEIAGQEIPPREFKVGDKVWLDSENVHIHQATPKLGPRQLGPYKVLEKLGDRDYRLKLPAALKIHPVFHVNRLSPWKGNHING